MGGEKINGTFFNLLRIKDMTTITNKRNKQ